MSRSDVAYQNLKREKIVKKDEQNGHIGLYRRCLVDTLLLLLQTDKQEKKQEYYYITNAATTTTITTTTYY